MVNLDAIGIDTFAQDLDTVLSNIVHMVQQQQAAATLPLQVSRDWIIRCVQEQIPPAGFTIEPKNPPPSSQGLGQFNTLPRELRDVIFAECLASGYPQFLACSRAMREEGMSQVWEKGVCRMNFDNMVNLVSLAVIPTDGPEVLQLTQHIAERIQHLRVRIPGTAFRPLGVWASIDFDAMRHFGGSELRRKSCTVLLEVEDDEPYTFGVEVVQALETLAGFERVDLRVVTSMKGLPGYAPVANGTYIPIHPENTYTHFLESLRRSLGRPSVGRDEEGLYVRFHPRQYVGERS